MLKLLILTHYKNINTQTHIFVTPAGPEQRLAAGAGAGSTNQVDIIVKTPALSHSGHRDSTMKKKKYFPKIVCKTKLRFLVLAV